MGKILIGPSIPKNKQVSVASIPHQEDNVITCFIKIPTPSCLARNPQLYFGFIALVVDDGFRRIVDVYAKLLGRDSVQLHLKWPLSGS